MRAATQPTALIMGRMVQKRPEVLPGRIVSAYFQTLIEHDFGPITDIAKRMMPYLYHPPPGNHSALVVHGERVEPAEGSVDQVGVWRPILRKVPKPGDLANQPASPL